MKIKKSRSVTETATIIRDNDPDQFMYRFPDLPQNTVGFIPLGGCNEVGMNSYAYGCNNRWIIVDLGIGFPSALRYSGVEFSTIAPELLQANKDLIEAVIITHAHEDHIGAIIWLSEFLPKNCPIYATKFAHLFLERKLQDNNRKLWQRQLLMQPDRPFKAAGFVITASPVIHSIPQSCCLKIDCPQDLQDIQDIQDLHDLRDPIGSIIHSGDWKAQQHPQQVNNFAKFAKFANVDRVNGADRADSSILAFIGDSTNALDVHEVNDESQVYPELVKTFAAAKKALVATCFASNLERVLAMIRAAQEVGRSTCLLGRSLHNIWSCAGSANLIPKNLRLLPEDIALSKPVSEVLFIATGCQAEPRAMLSKIAQRSFKRLRLNQDDTVIFSSSVIPGNELRVFRLQNMLAEQQVNVIQNDNLHSSGHANRHDIAKVYQQLKPQLVVAMHGEARHRQQHALLATECNVRLTATPGNGDCILLNGADSGSTFTTIPVAAQVLDGKKFAPMTANRFDRRLKMLYEGQAMVSIIIGKRNIGIDDLSVSLCGLCDDQPAIDDQQPPLINEAKLYLLRQLQDLLPPGNKISRIESEQIAKYLRSALRKFLNNKIGKKPEVSIHLRLADSWLCYNRAI